jgi:Holliday junction resolvase RusA-like endonuclease
MEFEIAGAPVGKRRPRFSTVNGFAQAIKVDADVEYENMVRLMFRLNKPTDYDLFDKPVRVRIEAHFPIPKSFSKKRAEEAAAGAIHPQKKPDADNIAKIICDALNNIAYGDDTQVIELTVVKKYAREPKVKVSISAYL